MTTLVAARFVNAKVDALLDESLTGAVVERIAENGAERFASARAVAGRLAERGYERLRLLDPGHAESGARSPCSAPSRRSSTPNP